VIDGRGVDGLTLDEASFELVEFDLGGRFSTDDFYEMQRGTRSGGFDEYHKAVTEFVRDRLGCDEVVAFHSQVRNAKKVSSGGSGVQGYAGGGPHTDTSSVSGDQQAIGMLEASGGDPSEYRRYLYVNLWKNIAQEPIANDHLAVMDERTAVKPDEYIAKDLFGPGYNVVQYGLSARHADLHKWYYFPGMTDKEAILFKQTDSDHTKPGRTTFHMSVSDPTAPRNAPTRESVETRMMCYWRKRGEPGEVDSMPTRENTNADMIKDPKAYAEELKSGSGGQPLASATTVELVAELLSRVPILGRLVPGPPKAPEKYLGSPKAYETAFVMALAAFEQWPSFAKPFVRGAFEKSGSFDAGVRVLAVMMVDDSSGHMKTKSLAAEEKSAIVEHLVGHDAFVAEVEKHFGDLLPKAAA